jgi:hypothetical protein
MPRTTGGGWRSVQALEPAMASTSNAAANTGAREPHA